MEKRYEEFRGCDNLVFAEVLTDTKAAITFGDVEDLAPIGEISHEVETSTATTYYDNIPSNVINAEGATTVALTVPVLPLATLAKILGKGYDADTGALMDGEATQKYYAVGVREQLTDGSNRYVWYYKGMFAVPSEGSKTKDNSTDTQNQTLTYTSVATVHPFTKPGKPQKRLVVDERDGKAKLDTFFEEVTTIDTLQKATNG